MPAFIGMGISAGSSILGGLFGASASEQAAQEYEAALQKSENFLQGQEQQGEGNYAPWLNAGQSATNSLSNLLGTPGQGLLTPWTQQFTAPTAAQAAATPGYQFQLQQGLSAAQNSAAGQGSLLSGRTLAGLNSYAQGDASTNYQNTFNNALTQYGTAYNTFQQNQNNQYQRLMGLSGQGLTAAQGDASLIGNVGGDIASLMGQQGAAQAQGTIGAANAYGSIFSGIGNAGSQMGMLSMLNGSGFGGGGGGGNWSTSANNPYWTTGDQSDIMQVGGAPSSGGQYSDPSYD